MIRFFQKDNRIVKAVLTVGIGIFIVSMVIYLIPGVLQNQSVSTDSYATVFPHWYSRYTFSGEKIPLARVEEIAQEQMQRQRLPEQYASIFMPRMMQQAGQQLILQKVLLDEAARLGIQATDEDVRVFLHRGQYGAVLFPNGQFIGEDKYKQFISNQFNLTPALFEQELKDSIAINRLRSLVTDGVTVSDKEIRDDYRKQNVKIKFDYAVISSDDLRKQINPTEAELQAFFSKNSARYANAVPEERKITYFTFTADQIPGGAPKVSDAEVQAYYNAHKAEYEVPEQSRSRHILIKYPGGAAKSDAEAKAKAEDILKQIQGGANFADEAKKYSEDSSKDQGGELGFARRGTMVPEFDNDIFTAKVGDVKLIHTQFGYHIVQVEERQTAHSQPLSEVLPTIQATLIRQKESQSEAAYAQQLANEAQKNGMAKTAADHHLTLVTTDPLKSNEIIAGLPDPTQVMTKAFASQLNGAPQFASTGEGYAVFQVTGIVGAHAPTFAAYKDQIAKDYADQKLPQLLNQKTQELADKAKASGDLAKAAKEVGATVKTSDLVGEAGQVPDFGQVGSVAPQLFTMNVGAISGPIDAQRTGVVAKIVDKQEPSADEIAKNLDQTREQALDQRREEAFGIFVSSTEDRFKKAKLIVVNTKAAGIPTEGQ
jgi:peptidyl-prolyl cis-trans isomerase D